MKSLFLVAGAAVLASAAPAAAKPHHVDKKGVPVKIVAPPGHAAHGCPPGLAKKGCLPPGQAKKLFNVGQRVPAGFGYTPFGAIPYDLRRHYGLRDDHRYIYRDDYIYRVDPATMLVTEVLRAIL